jgi:hypothetical protein
MNENKNGRFYLGIDPGLHGALALYRPGNPELGAPYMTIEDIPTLEITVNKKKRLRLDLATLRIWFDFHGPDVISALIEEPHSMPDMGAPSIFTFGFVCGAIQQAVVDAQIPYRVIDPAAWKKMMHLSADKDATRQAASRMFPSFAHLWARKCDDGRAEAGLLAALRSKMIL